jgi:protein tyrosine/serine phosphatase
MRTVVAVLLVVLTLAFAACAWLFYFDTLHLLVVEPGVLYRDGFDGMRHFENAYRQRPFKTVIDLQAEDDPEFSREEAMSERGFCKEHGIAWHSLPIRSKQVPTPEQMRQLVALVGNEAGRPVLVHDGNGVVAVGMMVAVWQKEGMGYPYERVLGSVRLFNHPEPTELYDFIKRLYNKQ